MTAPLAWPAPPGELALEADEVHVWRVPLAPPRGALAALARTLDPTEHQRAARFHFERDRAAFTAVRGALRTLAGRYLAHPPERLALGYRDRGKPYLTAPAGAALRFNVSHSGAYGLLAFTRAREVGVDVEQRRALHDLLPLANTSFSPHEYAALCALPAELQTEAFFACWSRKEAFIKATGDGISQLAAFDVSLRPGEPARLLRIAGLPPGQQRWSIHDLPAIPDHAAALVVEGQDARIACWDGASGGA